MRLRSYAMLAATLAALLQAASLPAAQGFRGNVQDAVGPAYGPNAKAARASTKAASHGLDARGMAKHWNEMAVNASGLDHTPVHDGEARVFGEQLGPARASRAMAIVHIAMFDAVNAIRGAYRGYTGIAPASPSASEEAAIAQAAHDTLVALFPSQRAYMDEQLAADLDGVRGRAPLERGVDVGRRAAAAILRLRDQDGSQLAEPRLGVDFFTSDAPGSWRQDPVSLGPLALGADWDVVKPFVMQSATQFRVPPPPALTSPEYAAAFAEAKEVGGDGIATPTRRTPAQTEAAIYWAYDGTPSLCAPPRLYNQISLQIADQMGSDAMQLLRLLALVNTAMADAGIAVWESKYHYEFWRPVTGIREADEGTGPSKAGDGNPATMGDIGYTPLGAPASNLTGPNFTPPFPSYPSGHAGFGGALFETLRRFYGRDDVSFTFVSDEFNGTTVDHLGQTRPLLPRSFASFSQAEEENGQSRIYLGIHWAFDKTQGIAQGRRVADYVFEHAFLPLH